MVRVEIGATTYAFEDLSMADSWLRKALNAHVRNQYDYKYIEGTITYKDIDGIHTEITLRRYFDETETAGSSEDESDE